MEKKKSYGVIIFVLFVLVIGTFFAILPWRKTDRESNDIRNKFEAENFVRAIDAGSDDFAHCSNGTAGAVVPHHLVGGKFITDVFAQLDQDQVETIVLIGPNHLEKGESIITSDRDWLAANGKIYSDSSHVEDMLSKGIATLNNEVISNDHSINNIIPFIAHYLPRAKVVPIILKKRVSEENYGKLLDYLKRLSENERVVMIGSVDFSHYLSVEQADKKDGETLNAITTRNYNLIDSYNHDHLDSPLTLNAILKVTDKDNIKMKWRNTNSFKILNGDINNTTSYFELVFCRNEK